MKYIIMCGGPAWDVPRQLLEIHGEAVVARTIRLLHEACVSDISISSLDKRFEAFGVPVIRHDNPHDIIDGKVVGCWVDAFPPCDEPACYIMGDVVFSPEAIRTIVSTETDDIQFFASRPPFHRMYVKRWAEPFAFKVANQRKLRQAIDICRRNACTGMFTRHPIAWELWQVINGEDPKQINYNNYVVINDYTCDIDKEADVAIMSGVLDCVT